jgi:hypothetical protein
MKRNTLILFLFSLALTGCIGDDFIDDRVDERISIDNPISEIQVDDKYQMEVTFFNNVGQPETNSFSWFSNNQMVATVNSSGLLSAISEGEVTIRVSVNLNDGGVLSEEKTITVVPGEANNGPITKSGTIFSTSSYTLEGEFTISEIEDTANLFLDIADNYQASTSLHGLYIYLSNNPGSIDGALELGPVEVFSGAHSYTIENVGINEFEYVLYWCKPFSVRVGRGRIND